jgi:hypothetical protein
MACYSAAGYTWGATVGSTAPARIIACNGVFGTCSAACAKVALLAHSNAYFSHKTGTSVQRFDLRYISSVSL